ncbi:sulfatase-like hydrolase/transferase [Gracilimonas sp. Q87]|uniref:sulfatase-like hydrolase/transferase n=1 Tax=Gracilimonas sp. Q87 TaxID=3384766 RepID=UPI003984067F
MKTILNYLPFSEHEFKNVIATMITFLLLGLLIRVYEVVLVSQNFTLPEGSFMIYLKALVPDLFLFSFWAVVLILFWALLTKVIPNYASKNIKALIVLFIIIYITLIQYFGEVLVLLGADFWAYEFTEISDTVSTSVSFGFNEIAPLIFFPLMFIYGTKSLRKLQLSDFFQNMFLIVIAICGLLSFLTYPSKDDHELELTYALSVNKASYFFGETASHLLSKLTNEEYTGAEYPFMKEPDTEDVLGPLLNKPDNPPNFVFIIVEGLGGTVVNPNASYGGFTPFLDSLSSESLYWTHFLATSGRSFNAQPSIFGSLPYGNSGFMDLGYRMPEHHSLISILDDSGYQTSYFGGYDTTFDNLDLFLERQGIDLLVNSSRFPDTYQRMDEIEGGFSWGYSDHDLYDFAFTFLDDFSNNEPRLDIFFSLNFHEPFIIPNTDRFDRLYEQRLQRLKLSEEDMQTYRDHPELFKALLYTDDSIRQLIEGYKQRQDFDNTIFIITGDHRMVPIPHRDRIDRYYVPFMIYSPLLKESKQFKGVSSHLDVAPTLTAYLSANFENEINIPDQVHWLGSELSTSEEFVSNKKIPFMRTKNNMADYLSGEYFVSDNRLYKLFEGMLLGEINDPNLKDRIYQEFEAFKRTNRYVTTENKLIELNETQEREFLQLNNEIQFLRDKNLTELNNSELFYIARDSAFNSNYEYAQILLRHVLRRSPNFHDARLLHGRTMAWSGDYDNAISQFKEVMKRAPDYQDTYSALSDVFYWQGMQEKSLEHAEIGLAIDNTYLPLIYRKARSFYMLGRKDSAKFWINKGLNLDPDNTNLRDLQVQLSEN